MGNTWCEQEQWHFQVLMVAGWGGICELGKVTLLQNEQEHDSSSVKFFFSIQYDGSNWKTTGTWQMKFGLEKIIWCETYRLCPTDLQYHNLYVSNKFFTNTTVTIWQEKKSTQNNRFWVPIRIQCLYFLHPCLFLNFKFTTSKITLLCVNTSTIYKSYNKLLSSEIQSKSFHDFTWRYLGMLIGLEGSRINLLPHYLPDSHLVTSW